MKKLLISLLVLCITAPVFAINDAPKVSRNAENILKNVFR